MAKKISQLPLLPGGTAPVNDADALVIVRSATTYQVEASRVRPSFLVTLLGWAAIQAFIGTSNIVRDANGVLLSMNVVWPDGGTGVWTTDAVNAGNPAIDAWHVTYVNGAVSKLLTQTAVTRDGNGAVINQPTLTVS